VENRVAAYLPTDILGGAWDSTVPGASGIWVAVTLSSLESAILDGYSGGYRSGQVFGDIKHIDVLTLESPR